MDVGLNNKNTLGEIDPEFKDIVFLVKATSFEQFNIWQEYSKQSISNIEPIQDRFIDILPTEPARKLFGDLNNKVKKFASERVEWEQISSGFSIKIGNVNEMPVNVSFSFAIINGKKICFYEAISRIVDYVMVEDWLIDRFQLTNDNYTRWNHVNASNFHNCINSLDRLDKEVRDTVYEKH